MVLLSVVALGMAMPSLRDEVELSSYPANGENLWDFGKDCNSFLIL